MSSMYGLAVDQVLALEVVLPSGRFVTVTEETDPDLFWGIRGGGGSKLPLSMSNQKYDSHSIQIHSELSPQSLPASNPRLE